MLMLVDLCQPVHLRTVLALYPERMDDLADNSGGASDSDVFMTHRTVLLKNQPPLNASLTE